MIARFPTRPDPLPPRAPRLRPQVRRGGLDSALGLALNPVRGRLFVTNNSKTAGLVTASLAGGTPHTFQPLTGSPFAIAFDAGRLRPVGQLPVLTGPFVGATPLPLTVIGGHAWPR